MHQQYNAPLPHPSPSPPQVERLVQIAEDYVGESLTPTTVVAALTLAAGLKLERLKTCCFDFVAQHAQAVRASHTMSALPAATLKVRPRPPCPYPAPLTPWRALSRSC